ncbi:murein biosynthesis integral membrane protein MurJ [Nocardioides sp. TRM66260-LWL]|uniref:murein biosynthesis integral membrane protein MurJ n=1 Tax=Nocardioides sp. TRM66260-LWL TaxID=2874478 RepID=UPI001CC704F3|nr:murein biosynthesis integral membrane protein MurJ [Nocardioides sp. TRM66260-LWL]MBZ5735570.1 murein biosynthesis integral membrane protein MurJ [Nocardioides sp. TRM66260-LWL]
MSHLAAPSTSRRLLSASAVMAAGTVVSRLSGFVRAGLLAAALGVSLHAELFTIANTIPNMLYILLAGGVFNAVLVPQLVRAAKEDADGGAAYIDRIVTVAFVFLVAVTALLMLLAPLLLDVYLSSAYDAPGLAAQRASIIDLTRYCLPQVFFYGMFVLVGQVLNARGRFGPMMWAPIANNVVSIAVLVGYLVVFGPALGDEARGAYSTTQELVLGVGSTIGIAAQLLILLPYLRAAGVRLRPRFDLRGTGLGRTARLAVWTVAFVVVNQIAYAVIVRLASGGVAEGASGTGYTVYSLAFLIVMVPHGIVTVSLATAVLPDLSASAADGDLRRLSRVLGGVLRSALVLIVPFAALLPLVAEPIARVMLHGAAGTASDVDLLVPTLALFGPGIVLFTVHYVLLRGFYAIEETRTVFVNQCWVALTNVVVALVLVHLTDPEHTAPALVAAYTCSYLVGSVLGFSVLRRRTGGLEGRRLTRFAVRLGLAVLVATLVAGLVVLAVHRLLGRGGPSGWPSAIVEGALVTAVEAGVLLLAARALRLTEVTDVVDVLTRRLRPGARA